MRWHAIAVLLWLSRKSEAWAWRLHGGSQQFVELWDEPHCPMPAFLLFGTIARDLANEEQRQKREAVPRSDAGRES